MPAGFQFKQFGVSHDKSTMKVGTDAVLLGAWAAVEQDNDIMEAGTGCGVIALMLAQRCYARITAIDMDENSAKQATENVNLSPWNDRIDVKHISIQDFVKNHQKTFNHLICNPPFFTNSLKASTREKNLARHDDTLPSPVLFYAASRLLDAAGKISLIIPFETGNIFNENAYVYGFMLARRTIVFSKEGKKSQRLLLEYRKTAEKLEETVLYIRNAANEYTREYIALTSDYYLFGQLNQFNG